MDDTQKKIVDLEKKLNDAQHQLELITKANEKYGMLLSHIEDFIWIMNKEFQITYISPSVKNILGYDEQELINQSFIKFCPPATIELFKDATQKNQENTIEPNEKIWKFGILSKEGKYILLETITTPIFSANHKYEGTVGVSRNITIKKEIEYKILEHEANLNAQFENTTDAIWSIDNEFKIKTLNKSFKEQFQKAFGTTIEIGSQILDLLPDLFKNEWKERYERALKGEHYIITDHILFKEATHYLEVRFNPIQLNHKIVGVAVFSRNITSQKIAEKNLIENEANQRALVENTEARIWSVDSQFNIIAANCNFTNDFKLAFNVMLKKGVYAIKNVPAPMEQIWIERYSRALRGEKFSLVDEFNFEDIPKFTKTSFNPIFIHNKIIGVSCLSQDITQQIINEQSLIESEQRFKFLSDASIELLKLKTPDEIIQYISKSLQEKLNKAIVIAVSINEESKKSKIRYIAGLSEPELENLNKYIGFSFVGTEFNLLPERMNIFLSGKFTHLKNGLQDLVKDNISPILANQISAQYQISNVYTIGIMQQSKVFAALQILSTNGTSIEDSHFIESYAHLISLVLHQQQLIKSLNFSEEKFRNIFDHSNSAITIQTDNQNLLINKAWEQITGYTIQEGLQMIPSDILHPQNKERIIEINNDRIQGKNAPSNHLMQIIDKHGIEKWIDISASTIEYEGQKAALVIGSDITDRKNKELEINQLSAGIINTPMSIVITDIDGNIEYVNPYFCSLTGYTFEEVLGQNPRVLQSGNTPREVFTNLWSAILGGDVWDGEFENKKKNGEHYWESARIAPILNDDGIIINFISVKEDITERKKNIQKLKDSEKKLQEINAQKDKFFSIIAHDLRSPFAGLVGIAGLLKNNFNDLNPLQIETYISLINTTTQNVLKLLEDLLTWARTQTGRIDFKPTPIKLKEIIEGSIQIQQITANHKNINITDLTIENITVMADNNMLQTIFRNLISNAIKYTHKNGIITLSAEKTRIHDKPYAIIAITDNGIGIPKDKQDKLFKIEENYTTAGTEKEKGSGLGLILCKEFVEMHGGKIWCSSTENIGSTFYFSLPILE
jgi:PAS domain S-box-containing protein